MTQARRAKRTETEGADGFIASGRGPDLAGLLRQDLVPAVTLEDFYSYMPQHAYLYIPTRQLWPAASVNGRLGRVGKEKASAWLDRERPVEQMTWAPGDPALIENRLIAEGGWFERSGVRVFNLYRPARIMLGNVAAADTWLTHVRRLYPDDFDHIVAWLAHRVQRPAEKINHALVLGGPQGIGKDTLLEPVKYAVGPWNVSEVSPSVLMGRFNGYCKAVILRVSEARDLGEVNRYAFYEHMKVCTAAPPDVLRVDEKNLREYVVPNVCGVILTTNHKTDGIYLPADDRRHYVAWSDSTKESFRAEYWTRLWGWYAEGGLGHVAAYLTTYDLSAFNAKAPPPHTEAWHAIVDTGHTQESDALVDGLGRLQFPEAVTLDDLIEIASEETIKAWLRDPKNSRSIPHRLEEVGYASVHNPDDQRGRMERLGAATHCLRSKGSDAAGTLRRRSKAGGTMRHGRPLRRVRPIWYPLPLIARLTENFSEIENRPNQAKQAWRGVRLTDSALGACVHHCGVPA